MLFFFSIQEFHVTKSDFLIRPGGKITIFYINSDSCVS